MVDLISENGMIVKIDKVCPFCGGEHPEHDDGCLVEDLIEMNEGPHLNAVPYSH